MTLVRRTAGRSHCTWSLRQGQTRWTLQRCRDRHLTTLAIETSCDDTSVAILEKHDVTANYQGPLATLHYHKRITAKTAEHRGIHPLVAQESHEQNLSTLVREAIAALPPSREERLLDQIMGFGTNHQSNKAKLSRNPDFISVTRGPGIRSSLNVGLNTAKGLAIAWNIPLVGVHHMQAHTLTPRLVSAIATKSPNKTPIPDFPFLTLLVSGGHTMLLSSESLIKHSIIATTADIAIGEAMDKIARDVLPLDLVAASPSSSYGPLMEKFAFPDAHPSAVVAPNELTTHQNPGKLTPDDPHAYTSPPSMTALKTPSPTAHGWSLTPPFSTNSTSTGFSFAGLVTQATRIAADRIAAGAFDTEERRELAREVMRVSFEHLARRVVEGLKMVEQRRLDAVVKQKMHKETEGWQVIGEQQRRDAEQSEHSEHGGRKANEEAPARQEEKEALTLVISGGVASNGYLRTILCSVLAAHRHVWPVKIRELRQRERIMRSKKASYAFRTPVDHPPSSSSSIPTKTGLCVDTLVFPPVELCTDNAAMIAWTGMEMCEAGYESELSVSAVNEWGLDPEGEDGGILGLSGWVERERES